MRADRLLTALLLLQAHRRLTGRELARRLEVSARTVHRDMEALSAAGVPVLALRGAHGGWCLQEDWRTQVPGLDEAELRALLMAQGRVNGDGALATATESALAKLMASLPSSMRERAVSIRERLYVDPSGWRDTTENLSALPAVQRGVSEDRQVRIRYCKAGGDTGERVVDPLGLVAKGNAWYLVAGTAEGFRTFRVSRIETAELLESPCRRPAHFDLVAHWTSSTARFDRDRGRVVVTMAVEAAAARRLLTYHAGSIAEETVSGEPDWATVTIRFDHEDEALFVCLGLGSKARVIEPRLLRERIEAEAVAVLQMRSVGHPAAENVDRVVHARRERDGE